jgi:transketolase
LDVNLVYFHTVKPIDTAVIERFRHTRILVVHDAFGLYEAISEVPGLRMKYHGLPDQYCVWYGTVHDIRARIGLDVPSIREAVRQWCEDSGGGQ